MFNNKKNIKLMRQFAQTYSEIGKQPVSQLPWGHIIVLMQQVKDPEARDWYAENALTNGIAEYRLSHALPRELQESLPDLSLLEAKLTDKMTEDILV